jgi:hypothetical protein
MLADARSLLRALEIARRAEYVELAGDPDYQEAFCAGVPVPEPAGASDVAVRVVGDTDASDRYGV